jgi:hypothetical protein
MDSADHTNYADLEAIKPVKSNNQCKSVIQALLDLRISLMATHTKITSRINPQKIQSAVLKPNMVNSS